MIISWLSSGDDIDTEDEESATVVGAESRSTSPSTSPSLISDLFNSFSFSIDDWTDSGSGLITVSLRSDVTDGFKIGFLRPMDFLEGGFVRLETGTKIYFVFDKIKPYVVVITYHLEFYYVN